MASSTRTRRTRSGLQWAALGAGALFLAAGALGFVPGATNNHHALEFAGPGSKATLLGIFQVSVLHNVLHGIFGLAGVLAFRAHRHARSFFVYGGVAYLALWLFGLVASDETPLNILPANDPDNILHLVLGLAMIVVAIVLSPHTPRPSPHKQHQGAS
ncbi:protein of unknown function [Pseudarthrobacter enclensis]|jgi:arginine exporter protein ArgO|uniref:DUF4383 domain-containing protein n=1 Tax=Pseudarthrobacter enclensis TaxID=993070 RepID=A0A0V8IQ90_9MICC|nr:DUF4383 domain-containing protein [Pseudarthrobacter enclensis]KSU76930.1 hypothetical protein AS031_10120 [Pseudarthrobacter enclensis]SCC05151.1 protein of unknown function [Pseudarthrobacter enclensis]